jgi:kynurenine formamidase
MEPLYLSYFLSQDTPAYGGAEGTIIFEQERSIERGDTSNNLKFIFPAHIGTHIDFPRHFSNEGKKGNDYPAAFWIFSKIGFIECATDEVEQHIDQLPADIEMIILKTGFGNKRGTSEYWTSQPVIPASLAGIFKKRFPALRVFGFDLISLTSKLDRAEGKKAHSEFLLENDILVLEDMDLRNLVSTPANVIIAPLQVTGADGVPCNVISY